MDVISPTASPDPHSNAEQIIQQERSNAQYSKLCTGLQKHVSQLSTNHNLQAHSEHDAHIVRGLFSCTSNDVFRAFCEFSIQETCYQPEKQRLVPNCPLTQIGFHKCEHTHYMRTEPNAFEKPELYLKPFTGLAPDHDNFCFSDCE